jgi:glycosyltransferase involved in cell wall biosynthesis
VRTLLVQDHFLKYSTGLASGLLAEGGDVAMLGRERDGEFGGDANAAAAFVERALGDRVALRRLPGRVRDLRSFGEVAAVGRALNRFTPRIVHLQESVVNDIRLLAVARPRPGRYAMTVHDPTPHPGDAVRARWKRRLRSTLIEHAGIVFVHGRRLRAELMTVERPRGAVVPVPHGIEEPEAVPLPDRLSLLFFGRLSYYKGLDILLDAMPAIWARAAETALVVAGAGVLPDHPVLDDRRVTVRQEHVPEEEVAGLFAASTCVVLPYRQASQSGVGSWAKRYGRPIVATEVGGLPELVTPRSGRLARAEDPAALAKALLEVLENPALARELGAGAAEEALGEASWRRVGRLTLDAYRRHLVPLGGGSAVASAPPTGILPGD